MCFWSIWVHSIWICRRVVIERQHDSLTLRPSGWVLITEHRSKLFHLRHHSKQWVTSAIKYLPIFFSPFFFINNPNHFRFLFHLSRNRCLFMFFVAVAVHSTQPQTIHLHFLYFIRVLKSSQNGNYCIPHHRTYLHYPITVGTHELLTVVCRYTLSVARNVYLYTVQVAFIIFTEQPVRRSIARQRQHSHTHTQRQTRMKGHTIAVTCKKKQLHNHRMKISKRFDSPIYS